MSVLMRRGDITRAKEANMLTRITAIGILMIGMVATPPVYGAADPAAVCVQKKAKAAGKKAFAIAKAFGKNVKKPDQSRLDAGISKAQAKFTKAFTKQEAKGGCATTDDAAAIESKVDAFLEDVIDDIGVPPTTTTTTVPSTTTTTTTIPPVPPLDHYRLYAGFASALVTVTIEDQWITPPAVVDIGDATAFLVPVEKDLPIVDPFTHLTAYFELTPPPFVPLSVDIDNQFGPQTLTVVAPSVLLVPTEKFPPGPGPLPPLPRDHFQCYSAYGPSVSVPKTLTDQFSGPDPVTVLTPGAFCNPASKDGSPILGAAPEHLTCYSITPPGIAVGPIPIKNQFTEPAVGTLDVFEPVGLCVPSFKLAFATTTTVTLPPSTTTTAPSTTTTTVP
jgi:hypothetical protein